ncbi:hypothetical protein HK096_008513 [Nowakowskiella sp. JEL0078]|nr:hypothetical protein HK096_008513 [Nowakowskiella sp. JEL0078]
MNPGGSAKDRVALYIVKDAEKKGTIIPNTGCTLFEGTVGSTGVALALIARVRGYKCHIVMPDDQSNEKYDILSRLGVNVERVRPVSIVDRNHFVNVAKRRAAEQTEVFKSGKAGEGVGSAIFCDQFENLANFQAHFETTGPEIYNQVQGKLDAFVMGSGTGGTLAGVSHYLKQRIPNLRIVLADPHGSGLFNKVKFNVMYSQTESEGTRKRFQVDTVVEGVGINRMTKNFAKVFNTGWIEDAVMVSDQDAVYMARYILFKDGLFIGSSTAVNLVSAYRTAKKLGKGHRIATVLCDHGSRHMTKFWSDSYLEKAGLKVPSFEILLKKNAEQIFG